MPPGDRKEVICPFFNLQEVENVEHLVTQCPFYAPLRAEMIFELEKVFDLADFSALVFTELEKLVNALLGALVPASTVKLPKPSTR